MRSDPAPVHRFLLAGALLLGALRPRRRPGRTAT